MKNILKLLLAAPFLGNCTNSIEISGVVKVKGSTPHTYLVIEDTKTNKNYQIKNTQKHYLEQKQNQEVKVKAKVVKKSSRSWFSSSYRGSVDE